MGTDHNKLHSSLTLFFCVAHELNDEDSKELFENILRKYRDIGMRICDKNVMVSFKSGLDGAQDLLPSEEGVQYEQSARNDTGEIVEQTEYYRLIKNRIY